MWPKLCVLSTKTEKHLLEDDLPNPPSSPLLVVTDKCRAKPAGGAATFLPTTSQELKDILEKCQKCQF